MSTSGKPPSKPAGKGPVKPFLGEDDLSELDAWVETFDALHMTEEGGGPPPDPTELVRVGPEPGATAQFSTSDLDDQLALDGVLAQDDLAIPEERPVLSAVEPAPIEPPRRDSDSAFRRASSVTSIDSYDDPNETDFSTLTPGGTPMMREPREPAFLGAGASRNLPLPSEPDGLDGDDEGDAFGSDDDDDVFTSASRPSIAAPPDEAGFDDPVVPPPAPEPRRTPAIVRRTPEPSAADSDAMFSEQTRVADFSELEQRRVFSSRQSQPVVARAETAQQPDDEDDYLDIEVSDDKAGVEGPAPELPTTGRRTAHVLRRGEATTRPPINAPIAQMPREARPPSNPASEEDFSDVAAAVGASDDGDLALPEMPARRPSRIPEISTDVRPQQSLDDALAGLPTDEGDSEPPPFADPNQFDDDSLPFADPHEFDEPQRYRYGSSPGGSSPGFGSSPGSAPGRTGSSPYIPPAYGQTPAPASDFADSGEFDEPNAFDEPAYQEPAQLDEPADDGPHPFDSQPAFDAFDEPEPPTPPPGYEPPTAPAGTALSDAFPPLPSLRTPRTQPPPLRRPEPAPAPAPSPALAELYPRIKTPTSVPPIGQAPAASSPAPSAAVPPPMRTMLEFGPLSRSDAPPDDAPPPRSTRLATQLAVDADAQPDAEPVLDLESVARGWPEQVEPLETATLDEASAQALLVYERELATVDDSAASAALRIEAGRLCERLTDLERARAHYDAALISDPRATAALRGLRRLARTSGDLAEAIRHLDAEIGVAGALERRPLGHYRVDLMMASNEQDLARVAAGELLDQAPSDVRALLAQLELAFLDGRADEFGVALEQLAQAVSDTELRAALQSARGALAAHHNDTGAASSWFAAAAESDPTALAALLGAIRQATGANQAEGAARSLVDLARQVESSDPVTAAAAAVRAQQWSEGELGLAAGQLAASAAPNDPLVARLAAFAADPAGDPITAANAFIHWAHNAGSNAERGYAAARAAELDPSRGAELWASALALDPGDDYAAAQLRTSHVAAEATQAAIDVDLEIAGDDARDRARLRAAYGMIAQGQLDGAIEVLQQGRAARPGSIALSEALGEALAAAGKWTDRAKLFAELADEPGEQLDKEVAQLRSALAWEEAVGAAASAAETDEAMRASVVTTTASALDAWERVLERGSSPSAHAAAIVLASRLGDSGLIGDALLRAQSAERVSLAAASLALRRARLIAGEDPQRHETILRDLQAGDDPRRTLGLVLGAARRQDIADAASALEERAGLIDGAGAQRGALDGKTAESEVAALRLRAAQLALDAGEAARATQLLLKVESALPQLGVVADLLAAARRRAGDRPSPTAPPRRDAQLTGAASADAFARVMRDADLAATQGDAAAALALYQRALELRPGDPLAAVPLVRVATQLRDPAPIVALALAQLRAADEAGDAQGKATAYELLAHIDSELRGDPGSAQISLESAAEADPARLDLVHRLERQYAVAEQPAELLRLRQRELAAVGEGGRDKVSLLIDLAGISERDGRPEHELAELYRQVLALDPTARLALLHLESIVRRAGFSAELAELEEKIATYFEASSDSNDARTQAAFWTRAGETLAELGRIDEAVQRFGKADAALPGHVPALEGWRQAALKGQLWIDVAEAATRQAAGAEGAARAHLYHFAGVALMDKALVGERAMAAFRKALDAEPGHRDAFLRLRILLEEDANHDDLASLLAMRLEVERDPAAQIELHRALAELHRNFLSDRDTAKNHYRAILAADANDLRAHAAIADIAWEQGNWQEAADALMARARLERAPDVLKTLCFRLGLIYADRLVDVPMALKAFQRALTFAPDDENTLIRLADLAVQVGEWKLALGACERLVKNESDPDRRAGHLHRVARIFKQGFGDLKKAERALNLALDGAPTNDEALAQLVQFYREANDLTSVRVHLNRVAGAMRARVILDPQDGVAYRVIARAMSARAQAGVVGSLPVARAAAELADLLGASGEPEQRLLQTSRPVDLQLVVRPEADEVMFPRGVPVELRHIFQLLGERIAKHVGVDLRPYGVTRGDRLRGRENPVAAVAQSVATGLGFGEIDVYISNRQPWVMVAEPTSPVSLVIGSAIAGAGGDAIRFASGSALKLAQASLAIPARLSPDDLGILVLGLLRLFQPDFPVVDVEAEPVAAQTQKLRRLIPTGLMNELKPFALAIDPQRFRHLDLARDLRVAGMRAGLVASGSLLAGLRILAAQLGGELPAFLADPTAQGLIAFALGEDHAVVAR